MKAYITLLCSDLYLKGVLILNKSLINVNSKYPLYCAILNSVSESTKSILEKSNIKTIEITNTLTPSDSIIKANKDANLENWTSSINKLRLFSFTDFEKLVYLDADIMVLNNIDVLFSKPHMSGVNTCRAIMPYLLWHGINSGLMIIDPKERLCDDIFSVNLPYPKDTPICDQNYIENYYPTWYSTPDVRLPDKFHIQSIMLKKYEKLKYTIDFSNSNPLSINVIHFVENPKLWTLSSSQRLELLNSLALQNSITVLTAYSLYFDLLKEVENIFI